MGALSAVTVDKYFIFTVTIAVLHLSKKNTQMMLQSRNNYWNDKYNGNNNNKLSSFMFKIPMKMDKMKLMMMMMLKMKMMQMLNMIME